MPPVCQVTPQSLHKVCQVTPQPLHKVCQLAPQTLHKVQFRGDFEYCIMDFSIDYITKEINTVVWKRDKNVCIKVKPPEKLDNIKTFTDMDNLLRMVSCVRFVVLCKKIWVEKKLYISPSKRYYEIGMKIVQMEVILKHITSLQSFESEDDSIDEEERIELMKFLKIL